MKEEKKDFESLFREQLEEELDLEGIFVSESLLQSTLEKIQQMEVQNEDKIHSSQIEGKNQGSQKVVKGKPKKKLLYTIASALAACFVLVVGFQVLKEGSGLKKSADSNAELYTENSLTMMESEDQLEEIPLQGFATEEFVDEKESKKESNQIESDFAKDSAEESKWDVSSVPDEVVLSYENEEEVAKIEKILTLLTSDELSLTADEVVGNITTQLTLIQSEYDTMEVVITREGYLNVKTYQEEQLLTHVTYVIRDLEAFQESVRNILVE